MTKLWARKEIVSEHKRQQRNSPDIYHRQLSQMPRWKRKQLRTNECNKRKRQRTIPIRRKEEFYDSQLISVSGSKRQDVIPSDMTFTFNQPNTLSDLLRSPVLTDITTLRAITRKITLACNNVFGINRFQSIMEVLTRTITTIGPMNAHNVDVEVFIQQLRINIS